MKLLIADDEPMLAAVAALRGEWTAQSGAELKVEGITSADLEKLNRIDADAIIAPVALRGSLAERGLIRLLPRQAEFSRDQVSGWGDVFDLLRTQEACWGGRVCGIPFGSPLFVLYVRKDIFDQLGLESPRTWGQFDRATALLTERRMGIGSVEGASGNRSVEGLRQGDSSQATLVLPLAPGWAGLTLLAWAAPSAKGRSNYSSLFDINSMDPLIAGPPFVESLERIARAVKDHPEASLDSDPHQVRSLFWQGRCVMAMTWPTRAAAKELPERTPEGFSVAVVPVPGSHRVYETSRRAWINRSQDEPDRVPLLSVAGRLGMVSAVSARAEAALELLLWLSDEQRCSSVGAASQWTTMPRRSQVDNAAAWTEPLLPAPVAKQYGKDLSASFQSDDYVAALSIPGRTEYLAALDDAVRATVRGEEAALEALINTARRWRDITERLGVEEQKRALRRSLGIEPPAEPTDRAARTLSANR